MPLWVGGGRTGAVTRVQIPSGTPNKSMACVALFWAMSGLIQILVALGRGFSHVEAHSSQLGFSRFFPEVALVNTEMYLATSLLRGLFAHRDFLRGNSSSL